MQDENIKESSFIFNANESTWVLRIIRRENGPIVEFNHEAYPNCLPDAFAEAFGSILMSKGYLDRFLDWRLKELGRL